MSVSSYSSTAPLQSISGLASGLDTASIISTLISLDRQPQVLIDNQITVEQARQSALQNVQSQLQSLSNFYQAIFDPTTWSDTQAVSSSNDSVVSAALTNGSAGAAAGGYDVTVSALARANQWTGTGVSNAAAADNIYITVGSTTTTVGVNAGDSLATIASNINAASNTPVYASVLNGNLVLSDRSTGTANAIASVTTDGTSGLSFSETQTAQDAAFTVNGTSYTSGSNIVTDALAGVTLTLKGEATAGNPVTVTVGEPGPDTSKIESALTSFIKQYDSTVSYIQGQLDQQVVPNPKNDAERTQGVLSGDSGLENLLSSLRQSFSDLFTSAPSGYQSLTDIGISTGAAVGSGPLSTSSIEGMITLDTTTFESALSSNFGAVKNLFINPTGSYSTEGLSQRLQDVLQPWTDSSQSGILTSRIGGETSTITSLQSESAAWDVRLQMKQQAYQAQFTQMETALSQLQSEGQWLTGQIAKLP